MQALYAFDGSDSDDFKKEEKFLSHSMEQMYDLYLMQLSLLIEVRNKAEDLLQKSKKKHLATEEEKNPNTKFIDNRLLLLLQNNQALKKQFDARKIDFWNLDFEYVDIILKAINESGIYRDYMASATSSFEQDRQFVHDIFTEVVAPNQKLYEYIEDKKLTWADDLPVVNTILQKLLRQVKYSDTDYYFTPDLYKDSDDRDFAFALFKKTLLNRFKYSEEISAKALNWDSGRIASLDLVLLQMAICEFLKFPSIPTKVTINEYLEIAKEYSTPKSSIFINGVLDKIVKEYDEKGMLNKIGRGLM